MFKQREDSRLRPSQISVRRMRISPSSSSEALPACDDPRHSSTAATSVASPGQLSSSRSTARVCSSSARGRARRSRKKPSSSRHCRPFSTLISNSRMSRAGAFPTPADSRAGPLARAVPPRASGAVPGSAHKSPLRMFRHSQRRSSSRSSCIQNPACSAPGEGEA
jgi:hypothetical protein